MKVRRKVNKWMLEVRNLDEKRVLDRSRDNKLIVIRRKDCIMKITANADQTMNISHSYVK